MVRAVTSDYEQNGRAIQDSTETEENPDTEVDLPEEPTARNKRKNVSNANTYAAKKTVAQGMMDIALITANANQLRYILDFGEHNATFFLITTLIILSIILQIAVGVCLIFKGKLDLAGQSKEIRANQLNNYVVMGVFLVTIINVFVATFTVTPRSDIMASSPTPVQTMQQPGPPS